MVKRNLNPNQLIFMLVLFLAIAIALCSLHHRTENNCGFLHLGVNAHKSSLLINWRFTCERHPDTIILFKELKNKIKQELMKIKIEPNERIGIVTSDVAINTKHLPCYWNSESRKEPCDEYCLPYFIQSFRRGNLIDWSCLSIQPSWMKDFGTLRIGKMVIPGQVNAGTTETYPLMSRFYSYQNLRFWTSLVYGIRYFDISIGMHGFWKKDFYTYSSNTVCIPLLAELQDIAKFLKKSIREVVIIDLSKFHNFSKNDHETLAKLLVDIFGKLIAPPYISKHKFGPKLEDMWEINKRVIINYRNDYSIKRYDFLWNDIYHKSALTTTSEELKDFIREEARVHVYQEQMCCITLALFPTWQQLILQGQKKHADSINPKLTYWLDKFKAMDRINIVATSFFLGNNVISRAILENKKKLEEQNKISVKKRPLQCH